MSRERDHAWAVKSGAAVLATCLVRAAEQSDPEFKDRFLKLLEAAYYHYRDHEGGWTTADGQPRETIEVLEMISWTREMITGWSNITGQGKPFLEGE